MFPKKYIVVALIATPTGITTLLGPAGGDWVNVAPE